MTESTTQPPSEVARVTLTTVGDDVAIDARGVNVSTLLRMTAALAAAGADTSRREGGDAGCAEYVKHLTALVKGAVHGLMTNVSGTAPDPRDQ